MAALLGPGSGLAIALLWCLSPSGAEPQGLDTALEVPEVALDLDNECTAAEGEQRCALSALQLRGQKVATAETRYDPEAAAASADEAMILKAMGRAGARERPIAANVSLAALSADVVTDANAQGCADDKVNYSLSWKAQGANFFEGFTFVTVDETHGAHEYVSRETALRDGLVRADDSHAIIRTAWTPTPYKRKSVNVHTNFAWDPSQSIVVAMKYNHLPTGCGVWPGFWAMNSDQVWPGGGELDILEYANSEPTKVTFHIDQGCTLDTGKMASCLTGASPGGSSVCATDYFKNLMGCRPPQRQFTGEYLSSNPGVMASEWTPTYIKVFHIPESEIPADLANDKPVPGSWDKFLISYMPFTSTCSVGYQEFVLNIQFCGDWAGNAWEQSNCPGRTALSSKTHICNNDIFNPPMDCCTRWITSPAANSNLHSTAYFDISYLKVYAGSGKAKKASGTFMRGGVPLTK